MISLIIPTYTINEELEEMAIIAALSYREQVHELIVVEDGGKISEELMGVVDIYVRLTKNYGFTTAVNEGWRLARGNYLITANSDTQLIDGNLKDLCKVGKVTCPKVSGYNVEKLCGAFFCVPSDVIKERGYLREEFPMYGSDSEFEHRTEDIFEYVPSVDVYHKGASTTSVAGVHP